MSEVSAETTAPPPTEAAQPNTPEAREADGTLKDQTSTQPAQSDSTTTPTTTPSKVEGEAKADAKADGAPETYADFKAPEGITLSKDMIAEAAPIFKELGLNQDQAQKLIDFAAKNQIGTAEANKAAYETMREGWRNDVLKDTTLATGNDLKPEVRQAIGRAVDALGAELGPQFRQVLDMTGVGDHPVMVKAMYEMSKFITEGRPVSGKGPSPAGQTSPSAPAKSLASAMFPNLAK